MAHKIDPAQRHQVPVVRPEAVDAAAAAKSAGKFQQLLEDKARVTPPPPPAAKAPAAAAAAKGALRGARSAPEKNGAASAGTPREAGGGNTEVEPGTETEGSSADGGLTPQDQESLNQAMTKMLLESALNMPKLAPPDTSIERE